MPYFDAAFDALLQRQLGHMTIAQLTDQGWSERAIAHAVGSGRLIRIHAGVYRQPGAPTDRHAQLVAACLACGPAAVASHRAAAHLWGLRQERGPVELTVPYAQCPTPGGVKLHRSLDLVPAHTTVRNCVPVTTPARLLVDAGAVMVVEELTRIVDAAVVKGLTTFPALYSMVDEVARRGRRGIGKLRLVLEDRPLGDRRPESVLEVVGARICRDHGVDRVFYQFEIEVERRTYRVDFGIPHVRLGIEIDGLEWHGTREATVRDRDRRRALKSAGWELLEFTAKDLYRRPAGVAREIRDEVRRREALFAALGVPPLEL